MQRNIHDLVARMSLEEKAGLCSGADFWHTKAVERLEVPAMMVSDGPHGLRTQKEGGGVNDSIRAVCFPAGCATAASFDTELMRREGAAIGAEAQAVGLGVVLGPAVNIKRSPLCGRNFEYYSEDPTLAGMLAAAFIEGVQGQGVGTSIKHFCANNQEYRRMTVSSDMDERTLHEIYLTPFEIAVRQAQPWTVMSSYNRLNGGYVGENRTVMTDVLRGEWGFEGFVMSDWGAVADRVAALKAGLDLEMPSSGGVNDAKIVAAVQEGRLDEATLDKAVTRILNIVFRHIDLAQNPRPALNLDADHEKAAQLAEECAVLLQNRGALPLAPGAKVAYIGGFAAEPRYQGGGSSHVNAYRIESALEAAKAKGRHVRYVEGFPSDRDQREEAEFLRAIEAAAEADVAVIFAGLPESFESEGADRKHMRLPEAQDNLIARVAAVQKNTVVVLHTGSPVECPWADDVSAVLCMYLGGEAVGRATDALLFGEASPSGRLPETWPLRLEDTPCYLDFPGDGHTARYREGVYVGYRWYDARKMAVRWPFGHGLSYTGFSYRAAALSADTLTEDGSVTVSLTVRNTGERAGSEVVQLYVADETGTAGRPPKELRHFAKVTLNPGQEQELRFTLTARDLSYYDPEMGGWYAAPGRYAVLIGHSSRNIPAVLPLNFVTSRARPLTIDENTAMGDLLRDARTAPILQKALARSGAALGENGGGDTEGVMAGEALAQMLDGMPLRAFTGFGGADAAAALPGLLQALRNALPETKNRE